MFFRRTFLFGCLLLFSSLGFGQTGNAVFGAGYSLPTPITAAPGQIMNLFVQGIGASLTQRVNATTLPLPTTLADISVRLTQSIAPQSISVPILAVSPASTCLNGSLTSAAACGHYSVITVQIPFELGPNCQAIVQVCPSATPFSNFAQLVISENGVPGAVVDVNPIADQVHVANLCDVDVSTSLGAIAPGVEARCAPTPLIAHADGTLVSASSPAKAGEEIVIYALGLGATKPAVPTGQATPSPAPLAQNVSEVNFDFQANAGPSRGVPLIFTTCNTSIICPFTPAFAGLTPGSVSLYQVNFVIPSAPQPMFACGPGIASNLTLTIVGSTSFDGAGICVTTSASSMAASASAALVPAPNPTIPFGSFAPNTIWFPTGADLTSLGQPLPPGSFGLRFPVRR